MTIKRILLSLFALSFLLIISAYWLISKKFDSHTLVHIANTELSRFIQQPIHIGGPLRLELLPRPGIRLKNLEIATPSSPYYSRIDTIFLNLSMLPLLHGNLVFNRLTVDGFTLILHPAAFPNVTEKPTIPTFSDALAVNRVLLKHGNLKLIYPTHSIMLSQLQLSAEQLNLKDLAFPFHLKTKLSFQSATPSVLADAMIDLQGNTALNPDLFVDPLKQLKALNINGQLTAQDIHLPNVNIDSLNASFKTQKEALLLNPLTLNLYHGESAGDLNLDLQTGRLFFNQTMTHLRGEDFFRSLSDRNPLNGSLDISIHAHLNCLDAHPLDSFSGNGNLLLKDGRIKNFNLSTLLEISKRKLHYIMDHLPPPDDRRPKTEHINPRILEGNTSFRVIALQFHIEHAYLQAESLLFQNDQLELKGTARYHFENNYMNSHVRIRLNTDDAEINKLQAAFSEGIPLHIYGAVNHLEIFPDTNHLLAVLQSMWIKRNLEQPIHIMRQQINNVFDLSQ